MSHATIRPARIRLRSEPLNVDVLRRIGWYVREPGTEAPKFYRHRWEASLAAQRRNRKRPA